ncbi:hypothetical protein PGIGA_G00226270 [Pangasianodon gigas]|uniref:Uncharacterized protein n=1 Tax=Pangasianodon gigas TaxID=30993 RepID=A0ACC5WK90_PANGG|nr:hypothetical protein [Pangasianodon gigas]
MPPCSGWPRPKTQCLGRTLISPCNTERGLSTVMRIGSPVDSASGPRQIGLELGGGGHCDSGPVSCAQKKPSGPHTTAGRVLNRQCHFSTPIVLDSLSMRGCEVEQGNSTRMVANECSGSNLPSSRRQRNVKGASDHCQDRLGILSSYRSREICTMAGSSVKRLMQLYWQLTSYRISLDKDNNDEVGKNSSGLSDKDRDKEVHHSEE